MSEPKREPDLDALEVAREIATRDKCDLFDFYHAHWDALIAELREHRATEIENWHCGMDRPQ